MHSNVYPFGPVPARSPRQETRFKELYDYRSATRVLAHDEIFDIVEPFASEVETRMMERRHGFGHLWPMSRLSPGLVAELRRIALPTITINGVLVLPADFRVVTELPPTAASMAATELEVAA